MRHDERGVVAVFGLVIVVMAAVVMIGVARSGYAAAAAARADTAADAAAIAAGHSLARNLGPETARLAARDAAAANGGTLVACDCIEDHAEVVVRVEGATGRARAQIRRDCMVDPQSC